jgi:hypothetical protein
MGTHKSSSQNIASIIVYFVFMCVLTAGALEVSDTRPSPLRELHIPFPKVLLYTPVLASMAAMLIWLMLRRHFRIISVLVSLGVFCLILYSEDVYFDRKVESISVRRWLTDTEQAFLTNRLSFPFYEHGSGTGYIITIERNANHFEHLKAELSRLGILNTELVPTTQPLQPKT